jgi:hypothetical protein
MIVMETKRQLTNIQLNLTQVSMIPYGRHGNKDTCINDKVRHYFTVVMEIKTWLTIVHKIITQVFTIFIVVIGKKTVE